MASVSIVPRERVDGSLQPKIAALEAALEIAAANFETVEAQRDRYHDEVVHLRKRLEMAEEINVLLRRPFLGKDPEPVSTELTAHERATLILNSVASRHGLTPEDIRGRRRAHRYVEARFEAVKAVEAAIPSWSLPDLGAFFDRDHTTIMAVLRRERRIEPRPGRPVGTPAPWAVRHRAETVAEAVGRVRAGENVSFVARDLGIPRQTVRDWVSGGNRRNVFK